MPQLLPEWIARRFYRLNLRSNVGRIVFDWSIARLPLATARRTASQNVNKLLQVVAASVILLISGCSRSPDEQALRQQIASMQAALKERSLSGVMDGVADDFGGSGGFDAQRMRRLVQVQIIGNQKLGATIGPIEIEMQGERATARFSVLLTGGRGGWLPDRGRAYRVESGWRVESGEWKVFHADWDSERD